MHINPYLVFKGNAAEAMKFYNSVLKGDLNITLYSDMPEEMAAGVPDEFKGQVMHSEIVYKGTNLVMATDSFEGMGPKFTHGDSFFATINHDNEKEARQLFDGIGAGGKVIMPLEKQFWGDLFGMLVDKYGVRWQLNCKLS